MKLTDFLSGPVADALGWTLLHALWQGFALVLPTAVVLHLLRNQSSGLRYRISVLTLLTQLLTSGATFAWYYEPVVRVLPIGNSPAVAQSLPIRWQAITQTLPWHQQVQQFLQLHLSEFVLVYLIGVALFGLRLAGGWVYLQRLSRTAAQPATQKWTDLTNVLRSVLAIRTVVRVRESARIAVPMVVGVLKPVLLLPIGLAANLSMREVEAVLAHELAHVKRHDYAVNLLQSVMEVLYFFHPALWWISARVREEREHCCDDLAVQAIGGDGRILAQALAHVEELRLTRTISTGAPDRTDQPALAMALVTNRQQLLHRVRRMLGVPTHPFVSNSSLAGLTLATVLLVSVSVYAVQQQDKPQPKPKPRMAQPQATRRHTVDTNSEYGMVEGKKVSYVIWKGQKLPASRVARLQRQLDQVMAGQLNLDDVKQPDRDILLKIIETNNAFDGGMDGLAAGLAQLDYNTIIKTGMDAANAAGTFPVDVDSVLKEVQKVDYNPIFQQAFSHPATDTTQSKIVRQRLDSLLQQMSTIVEQRQPTIEQLSKEMAELSIKINNWQKQTGPIAKQQAVLAKQQVVLAQQQATIARKLAPVELEIERLSRQQSAGTNKLKQQKVTLRKRYEEKMNRLGEQMGKLGTQMGELGTQMQPAGPDLEPYYERLGVLTDSIGRLSEPTYELSAQIEELSSQIAEETQRQAEKAMRQAENAMRAVESSNAIPARPTRAPRPPKAPNVFRPATPPAPRPAPAPVVAPMPKVPK